MIFDDVNNLLPWKLGDIYEGGFKKNLRHGKGKYVYANGDIYVSRLLDTIFKYQVT